MSNDPFDFQAFTEKALNPSANDETREMLRDAVSDEMEHVMGEVAPRIWAVIQREMNKDPTNNLHLNAVLNSAIFAVLSWTAVCTPKGETNGRDNDEVLIEKVNHNVRQALNARDPEQAQHIAFTASNTGTLQLMEDACGDLGKVLTANSMVIKGVHQTIKNMNKGG